MNVKTDLAQKDPAGGSSRGVSNESFLTLFMIGVLVVLFIIAGTVVPNFFLPQNMLNSSRTTGSSLSSASASRFCSSPATSTCR